jgi:hypothetical protein
MKKGFNFLKTLSDINHLLWGVAVVCLNRMDLKSSHQTKAINNLIE